MVLRTREELEAQPAPKPLPPSPTPTPPPKAQVEKRVTLEAALRAKAVGVPRAAQEALPATNAARELLCDLTQSAELQDITRVWCRRSGACLGTLPDAQVAMLAALMSDDDTALAVMGRVDGSTCALISPLWLDTSNARIRRLERVDPLGFATYLAGYALDGRSVANSALELQRRIYLRELFETFTQDDVRQVAYAAYLCLKLRARPTGLLPQGAEALREYFISAARDELLETRKRELDVQFALRTDNAQGARIAHAHMVVAQATAQIAELEAQVETLKARAAQLGRDEYTETLRELEGAEARFETMHKRTKADPANPEHQIRLTPEEVAVAREKLAAKIAALEARLRHMQKSERLNVTQALQTASQKHATLVAKREQWSRLMADHAPSNLKGIFAKTIPLGTYGHDVLLASDVMGEALLGAVQLGLPLPLDHIATHEHLFARRVTVDELISEIEIPDWTARDSQNLGFMNELAEVAKAMVEEKRAALSESKRLAVQARWNAQAKLAATSADTEAGLYDMEIDLADIL